jgi:hypothetical protein
MNTKPSGSLEEQVGELRSRVLRLEEALDQYGIVVQSAEAKPAATEHIIAPQTISRWRAASGRSGSTGSAFWRC